MYIVIHRQICFVLSELISVDRQARFPKLGSKPGWFKRQSKILPLGRQSQRSKFKRLWITIVIVYIYPLNGYRELDSFEEPCIYANGNTITSFARELNPTEVGEYIYIYIIHNIHKHTNFGYVCVYVLTIVYANECLKYAFIRDPNYSCVCIIYIYIYIYVCIYCHLQTDCFVVSQLFSVARRVGRLKLGSKPAQLFSRISIRPLGQQAYHVG